MTPRRGRAAAVLAASAQRQHREPIGAPVDELAPHRRPDTRQLSRAELVLVPFDDQRQLARDHQVDLLLPDMRVDTAALAGRERDQVDAERLDAELAPKRLEALLVVEVQRGERDVARRAGHVRHATALCSAHGVSRQ